MLEMSVIIQIIFTSEVEWSSTFEPKGMAEEEVAKMIKDIYLTALSGLKKLHNG